METINSLISTDRSGTSYTFEITEEPFNVGKYSGIYYKIQDRGTRGWKHFVFKIAFLDSSRILIFLVDNQNIPELTGKGIVKAMIVLLSQFYNASIVSSTNNEALKIDEAEGRIPNVTSYWQKWCKTDSRANYNKSEDRFYYLCSS